MKAQRLEIAPSFSRRVAISMRPSPLGTAIDARDGERSRRLELMVEQRRQAAGSEHEEQKQREQAADETHKSAAAAWRAGWGGAARRSGRSRRLEHLGGRARANAPAAEGGLLPRRR